MQYAPESKAASQIRLKRGWGDISDGLLVHESLPWLLGLYYVILLSISLPILFNRNLFFSVIILVLFIVPILYAYRAFNLKTYRPKDTAESQKRDTSKADKGDEKVTVDIDEEMHLESLKQYEVEINNLKVLFEVKEDVARQLVAKKFKPPQITYDRFILMIDKCNDLFYSQADTALNIIKLAAEDTPRIRKEVENKIDSMKRIIDQIEDLTNELVINISTDSDSKQEVQVLLDDMEDLIGSVKDYKE